MGGEPLIVAVLVIAWLLFLPAVAGAMARAGRQWLAPALAGAALAAVMALLCSPLPPVVSTFTGTGHIENGCRIALGQWAFAFPVDYPLTVPTLASLFVRLVGCGPEAYGAASILLVALAAAGVSLLARELVASRRAAWGSGLAMALLPPVLLFARGDSLVVGYLALAPWALGFALRVAGAAGSGSGQTVAATAWERIGLVVSLVLLAQSRPEAPLFGLVLLAAWLLLTGNRRAALNRLALPAVVTLLLLAPYLARLGREFIIGGRGAAELGPARLLPMALAGGAALVLLLAGRWWLWRADEATAMTPVRWLKAGLAAGGGRAAGLALGLLLVGSGVGVAGAGYLTPGPVCWDEECSALTFRTISWWLLNPKLVPWPFLLLALSGAIGRPPEGGRESRIVLLLWLWGVTVAMAGTLKMTGELPFEGLRTQLPAAGPFALLVGMGVRHWWPAAGRRWPVVAGGALILASLLPALQPVVGFGYDEQQEQAFVRRCLEQTEGPVRLFVPEGDGEPDGGIDLFALYRQRHLAAALGEAGERLEVAPLSQLGPVAAGGPRARLVLLGLACWRTGADSELEQCRELRNGGRLAPVCTETIDSGPYSSDYYERLRIRSRPVTATIFRLAAATEE